MRRVTLGQIGGINLTAEGSMLVGSVFLWLGHTALAYLLLQAPLDEAIIAGLLAVPLYWLSDLAHQLGHGWIARRVGHPMKEIRIRWFLIITLYPRDEPELSARTHIKRALGGPPVSLGLSLLALILVLFARNALSGPIWWVSVLFFIQNFFFFFLGSLLPLGFTDGSTLLRYLRQR